MQPIKRIFGGAAFLAVAAVVGNLASATWPMLATLKDDPRNEGVGMLAYHGQLVRPHVLVVDVYAVDPEKSPADVFRALLLYAAAMQGRTFDAVQLASRGRVKYTLSGDYFATLGREYGEQNPVYTMRTFAEHLRAPDGSLAFEPRAGGMFYVLGAQMKDFAQVHRHWYIDDLAATLTAP